MHADVRIGVARTNRATACCAIAVGTQTREHAPGHDTPNVALHEGLRRDPGVATRRQSNQSGFQPIAST